MIIGVPVVEGEGFCAVSLEAVEKELIRILGTDIIVNVQRELSLGKIPLWRDNERSPEVLRFARNDSQWNVS